MKKKLTLVLVLLIFIGTIFGLVDYNRVKRNLKPLFMLSFDDKDPYNYYGLGYQMQRFTGVSPNQPLSSDAHIKFGPWFFLKEISLDNKKQVNDFPVSSDNSTSCKVQDFEMNFYTDKKVYKEKEKIISWATIKYIGKKESVKIYHALPYITFNITDGKDFIMEGIVNDILISTTLMKDELYEFPLVKSGAWGADTPKTEEWKKFFNEKDLILPTGEYTLTSQAKFSIDTPSELKENKRLTCELNVIVEK